MPGYILHMAAAYELLPLLKERGLINGPEEENDFNVSNLIPDSTDHKSRTHYRHTDDKSILFRVPQPWRFQEAYPQLNLTPCGLGYLYHLYTDQIFYNDYFNRHIRITDDDLKLQVRKKQMTKVILKDFNRIISYQEYYEKRLIYDDYTIINALLEEKYKLNYDFLPVRNPGIKEVDYGRISEIRDQILYYSDLSRKLTSHKTTVLSPEPLLQFIETLPARFLLEYIDT